MAVLSCMSIYEEWYEHFWDIPKSQRSDCLTQGRRLYESYAIPREVRLISRDWQYLTGEMGFFADSNKVPAAKQSEILDRFNNAIVIEIGGDYSSDYQYLAVQEDLLMMVSCGIWD